MNIVSKNARRGESSGLSVELWLFANAFFSILALMLIPLVGNLGAAGFILFGLAFCIVRFPSIVSDAAKYSHLLILPVYCIVSALWSNYPDITFRYAIQLLITLSIAIIFATSLSSTKLIRAIFYAYLIGCVICVLMELAGNRGQAWAGFFGSKNGFAALASILWILSFAVQKMPEMRMWRLVALGYIFVGPIFIALAQSAGAILAIIPILASIVFFRMLVRMSHTVRIIATFALVAFFVIMGSILSTYSEEITSSVLEYFGKSPDLTGRTELWDYAYYLIAKNPLFGVGYRGFWVIGNADAEMLWAEFDVPSGAGFNFHNTYISNAVELGYVGVAIQVAILYLALYRGFKLCVSAPSADNVLWFTIVAFSISRSFSEVTFFTEFTVQSFLPYIAYIKIAQSSRALREASNVPTERQIIGRQPYRINGFRRG